MAQDPYDKSKTVPPPHSGVPQNFAQRRCYHWDINSAALTFIPEDAPKSFEQNGCVRGAERPHHVLYLSPIWAAGRH